MSIETQLQFNKVFLIQSLRDNEKQTGERLVEQTLKPQLEAVGLGLAYYKAASRAEFFGALQDIWKQCARESPRTYPIIHLDTHGAGDKSGIATLPSGEIVTWREFARMARGINVECHNNLLIVGALCYGLLAITEINMREPAPFLAVVGPETPVTVGEIDGGFGPFYEAILKTGSLDEAMTRLSAKFGLFLADRLFANAFATYIKQDCKGAGRQERIDRLLAKFMETEAAHRISEAEARRIAEDYTLPNEAAFERFKSKFLMADHPLNVNRFSLSFDDVMNAADRST